MKTLAVTACFALLLGTTSSFRTRDPQDPNPLVNTAWRGPVRADQEVMVIFHYKAADTLMMYMANNLSLIEIMRYTVNGKALTLQKFDGGSPCDTQTVGQYEFTVGNDELNTKLVADACEARANAWIGKPFRKVAVPTK